MAADYWNQKTLKELFEEQAEKTPDMTAIEYKDHKMTYGELNRKSNQLARLLRERGVRKDFIVGIMVKRSMEMLVGVMAVLKAGGAFLPLDPECLEERIRYMLEGSKASVLLTAFPDPINFAFHGLKIDMSDEGIYNSEGTNLENVSSPGNLAYVMYTSGLAGKPTGVMIEQGAVVNFIGGVSEIIGFSEGRTILSLASMACDRFILEALLPLTKGLRVIIAEENQQKNPHMLEQLLLDRKIDIMEMTPAQIQRMMDYDKNLSGLQNLKELITAGEAIPSGLLEKLKDVIPAKIYHIYGPTEAAGCSMIGDLTESCRTHIGRPVPNTRIYILDNNNNFLPAGTEGELCIAGKGLARGYLSHPGLTAEKFVPNPFMPGGRVFKTGDLARILPGGEFEYLGRVDGQMEI